MVSGSYIYGTDVGLISVPDDDRVQDLLFECCKIEASPIHVETKLEETKTAIPQNGMSLASLCTYVAPT